MELRLYGDYGWQKADQFGLWPLSAATLDALLYHADQELPAFLELESAIRACGELS
jgi:hypothetical protein